MDIWSVLGIEKTKDKDLIKKAYRVKLAKTNPEDDPEGFKELRAAYEAANAYADKPEENADGQGEASDDENDLSKFHPVIRELVSLYKDFYRRIDVKNWEEIFENDYFFSLDTAEEALLNLLGFVSKNYYLPDEVNELVVNKFEIKERKAELVEKGVNEEFLDYLINCTIYRPIIDYSLFEGESDANYDGYIKDFYKLDAAFKEGNVEKQQAAFARLNEYDIKYIGTDVLLAKHYIRTGEDEKGRELMEELYAKYPESMIVNILRGDVLSYFGEESSKDEIIQCYEKAAKASEKDIVAKARLADAYMKRERFTEAKDIYVELMKRSHYDNVIRAGLIQANNGIIKQNLKKLEESEDSMRLRMDTAWAYYQSYGFAEGIKLLDTFEPDDSVYFEYYNVKGRSYLCINEIEKALDCFKLWKSAIEGLSPEDKSEETEKKRVRYQYVNFLIGDCHMKLGDYENAEKYIDYALSKEHDEIAIAYEAKCELLYLQKRYAECIEACTKLETIDANNYVAADFKSRSYYELGLFNDALTACERVIGIYPFVINPYEIEMEIFMKVGQLDTVQQIIDRYLQLGLDSDVCSMFNARILIEEKKLDEALVILEGIGKKLDVEGEKPTTDIFKLDEFYLLLGKCYESKKLYREMVEAYKKAYDANPENDVVNGLLGVYYKRMGQLNEAVLAFNKQIEISPNAFSYMNLSSIYKARGMYELAEENLYNALKLDNKDYNTYLYGARFFYQYGKFADAEFCYEKALELCDDEANKIDIMRGYGRVLTTIGKLNEAEDVFRELIKKNGPIVTVILDYVDLMIYMGRIDEAYKLLSENVTSADTYKAEILSKMLEVVARDTDLTRINEAFTRLVSEKCVTEYEYFLMGQVLLKAEEYGKAEKMLLEAVKYDGPYLGIYYAYLAEAASKQFGGLGRMKRYINAFREKMSCKEDKGFDSTDEVVASAKIAILEKKYKEAENLLKKAISMVRCSWCPLRFCGDAYYELGKLYEVAKKFEDAVKAYNKSLVATGYDKWILSKIKRLKK